MVQVICSVKLEDNGLLWEISTDIHVNDFFFFFWGGVKTCLVGRWIDKHHIKIYVK